MRRYSWIFAAAFALAVCLQCNTVAVDAAAKKTEKKTKKQTEVSMECGIDSELSASVLLGNNITVYSTYLYTNVELKYLTCIIQAEAGNQSYKGKVAVGNVVLNRVTSDKYANSIKGVIYQKGQFEPTTNGSFAAKLRNYSRMDANTRACQKAAKAALAGENYVGDKLYFRVYSDSFASTLDRSKWQKIGAHIFFNY